MAQEAADEVRGRSERGSIDSGVFGDDREDGDVVVFAVYYPDARGAVEQYADQLAGKVVVDVTNPVNESYDALVTPPDGSATSEFSGLAPDARWVKAFNTNFANTLVEGKVAGQPLDVLIAGDDDDAKATVAELAEGGGLNAIDAGPLGRARELEAAGLLHISVQEPLGTGFGSALKVVSPTS
jgi:predicted dinucleotide-binding enzyme